MLLSIVQFPAALQPMTARPTAPSPHTPHADPFSTCKHRNLCYCPLSSSLPDPHHKVPTLHMLTPSPHLTETSVIIHQPVPLKCSQCNSSTVMQRGMNQWVNVFSAWKTQQQRPELPTVTRIWHVSKHKVYKLHQRHLLINSPVCWCWWAFEFYLRNW